MFPVNVNEMGEVRISVHAGDADDARLLIESHRTELTSRVVRLRDECAADGKAILFDQAKGYLMVGEKTIPYAEAALNLKMDEGAVRVAVHRLRKRYRELLRDEIAQTLDEPAQVAEELRSLQAALAG